MANQQHIEWLLEGVEAWNARREREDFVPDFSGADFTRGELAKAVLCFAQQSDLHELVGDEPKPTGINLSKSILEGTNLSNRDIRFGNFENSEFFDAKLPHADLRNANLKHANLIDAELAGTKFQGASLDGADFFLSNWQEAEIAGSKIWRARNIFQASFDGSKYTKDLPEDREITSITSLLDFLEQMRFHNSWKLYFRGEPALKKSNTHFHLTPSVKRSVAKTKNESKFLDEFFRRQPNGSFPANSALSELVLAQHYGLNTRLLDITRNPLVALYFCCESEPENDHQNGRLHLFLVPQQAIKTHNSDAISVLANFAKLEQEEQNAILTSSGTPIKRERALKRLYHFIGMEKSHFRHEINPSDLFNAFVVEPKQEFERIKAQSGAFLISALHDRFEAEEVVKTAPDAPIYEHLTMSVPYANKSKILKELALLNITRETLFPGMESSAQAVNNSV